MNNMRYLLRNFSNIECLDEYCLSKIFSYLSLEQLIQVEEVCPKWKNAATINWVNTKSFESINSAKHVIDYYFSNWESFVNTVMSRCGQRLKSICLIGIRTNAIVRSINTYCHNLEYIQLAFQEFDHKEYNLNNLHLLKHINITYMKHRDNSFCDYIHQIPNTVVTLEIRNNYRFGTMFLLKETVPSTEISSLKLIDCELVRGQFSSITNTNLAAIDEICLTKSGIQNNTLTHISRFFNLKKVDLSKVIEVNDAVLHSLATHCILIRSLDISSCKMVTDDGLEYLQNLHNLKILKINNLPLIEGENFANFFILDELYCNYCARLLERNVEIFMNNPDSNIRVLDASSIHFIGNYSFSAIF